MMLISVPHTMGDSDRLLWLQHMEAMIGCAVANIELSDQGQASNALLFYATDPLGHRMGDAISHNTA